LTFLSILLLCKYESTIYKNDSGNIPREIKMQMTDYQVIRQALLMWRNHIETGNVSLSQQDAINCGREKEINKLDNNQIEFTKRLEQLANKATEIESRKRQMQSVE
jgi:hypothetical protein